MFIPAVYLVTAMLIVAVLLLLFGMWLMLGAAVKSMAGMNGIATILLLAALFTGALAVGTAFWAGALL